MARKLFNADMEKRLLKTLLSTSRGRRKFAQITPEHFVTEVASTAYERVVNIMGKRGILMPWKSLCEDPGLPENVRAALGAYKTKPARNLTDFKLLIESSDNYRKLRAVNEYGKKLSEDLDNEELDAEDVLARVSSGISGIISDNALTAFHLGKGDNSAKMVRELLKGSKVRYIPTGLRAYDDELGNRGLLMGSLMIAAAPSGNGKSIMVHTLGRNMALNGAKVCMAQLEMDGQAIMQRELAFQMGMPVTKFIDPLKSMTKSERKKAFKAYKKISSRIRRNGGKFTTLNSEEDLSIEKMLAYCKANRYNVVIIDYVGLLAGTDSEDQAKALGRIARICKVWASANNALVILAAQLSDDGLVRYSRAMREHASNLWQWTLDSRARETGIIRVIQTKSRMQNDSPFLLRIDPPTMTIRDLTSEEAAEAKKGDKENRRSDGGGKFKKGGREEKPTVSANDYMDL